MESKSDFSDTRKIKKTQTNKTVRKDNMLINDLTKMEKIVASRSDLGWVGWDVVRYKRGNSAQFNKNGVIWKGQWHHASVFLITELGWKIPSSVIDANV